MTCPKQGWRAFKGERPAPVVEGFSSIADASMRLSEVWCEEAEGLNNSGKFRQAAEVYKRCLSIPVLREARKAELHACRARTFRMLAESKKKVRNVEDPQDGDDDDKDDPLHGLAAEWAVEEAEFALQHNAKNFTAAWEGAIAAKHI